MIGHEVVLPEEVNRLRAASAIMTAALVPFCLVGADLAARTVPGVVVPFVVLSAGVLLVALATIGWTTSPVLRRLTFIGGAFVVFGLLASLLGLMFAAEIEFADYLLRLVATAAATWAVSVLWPVVAVGST